MISTGCLKSNHCFVDVIIAVLHKLNRDHRAVLILVGLI